MLAALIFVLLAVLGLLGLLAFGTYLAVTQQGYEWPVLVALQSALWISISGHLAWILIRGQTRSPEKLAGVISEACVLLCVTLALIGAITEQLGWWTHGFVHYFVIGVSIVVLLGVAAYWTVGERRLKEALKARAAGTEP
jgi:peptidoglycan/LPS O-acetylase OafA/YrhL